MPRTPALPLLACLLATALGCAGPGAGERGSAPARPKASAPATPQGTGAAQPAAGAATAWQAPVLRCARLPQALAATWPGAAGWRADTQAASPPGQPAHCRLQGRLNERTGAEGQAYAIGFELRLPAAWNGRFLHQTHGGTDGVLRPATGALAVLTPEQGALARGFAVLSSDGGHLAEAPGTEDAGLLRGVLFGQDPQARQDFHHAALDALWPLAQAVVQAHYGRAPAHNYLAGCGHGGRLGLQAASRWPGRYQGILAGAPALHWPRAALQHPWDHKLWARVDEDTRDAFTPADMRLLAERVVARCDTLDMVADGMVGNLARCQKAFRLAELQCKPGQKPDAKAGCLSAAQIDALAWSFTGPHDSRGRPLYTDWLFDAGLGSAGWRQWRLKSTIAGWDHLPIGATMGAAALAQVFSTPPQAVDGSPEGLAAWLRGYDMDDGARAIGAAADSAPEARAALAEASPPDVDAPRLRDFARAGGRLIVYHGGSDPAFSLQATLRWTEALQAHWGTSAAQGFARSFAVPGMGHCQGGPATDRFDALGALVDWVEQGRAPASLTAQVNPANPELPSTWSRQRSRPLCPWPQSARYAGGDVEQASSFRCAAS